MRSLKEAGVRKREFLDAALELFAQKGYEKTTINDILDAVGVSRGAFYYYFESKEEILEDIARQYVGKKAAIMERTAEDKNLNALEKLNRMIVDMKDFKLAHRGEWLRILKVFLNMENSRLEQRILEQSEKLICPTLKTIIDQGVREGIFDNHLAADFADVIERLLGVEKGSIRLTEPFMNSLPKSEPPGHLADKEGGPLA